MIRRRKRVAAFKPREENVHAAILMLLGYILPAEAVVHHSPNEGKRGLKAQAALKKLGTRAGWPDLEVVYRGRVLFIEVKRPGEKPSATQLAVHALLRSTGCTVILADGAEQVRGPVAEWVEVCEPPCDALPAPAQEPFAVQHGVPIYCDGPLPS